MQSGPMQCVAMQCAIAERKPLLKEDAKLIAYMQLQTSERLVATCVSMHMCQCYEHA